MHVAIILILIALGSVAFHIWSPFWWTEIASNWGYVDGTIILTFWITGVVFVAVLLFTAYCVIRFRHREGRKAEYEPENSKLEWWLTILTTVGVAGMLAPGLFVWHQFITVPEDAAEVEAMGYQWGWGFRFPGKDGIMGKTDARNITADNTFGVNPDDPNGQDDIIVDDTDVTIPIGQPVKMLLRSIDVLHDFYVPQFRAKMDMIPGSVTYFWLEPTRTGTFDILCFELCGTGHYAMRGQVTVAEEADFQAWLDEQPTFAEIMAEARLNAEQDNDVAMQTRKTATAE